MAVHIWAVACLTIQFDLRGSFASDVCGIDSERCTEIDVPQPERNQAALFQRGVGKHRVTVTLADAMDADETQSTNSTVEATSDAVTNVATAPQAVPVDVMPAIASADAAAFPADATATDTGFPLTAKLQADNQDKPIVLADKGSATSVESHETQTTGMLYLASSLITFIQDIAEGIRQSLPPIIVYTFPSLRTDIGAVFGLSLASGMIWCSLVAAVACFYRSQKAFPQAISSRPEQDFNEWTSSPFDVCVDTQVCCWSCWCPCIRWADNMDMLGIMSFWVGLMVFCGLILLISVPGGLLLWLIAALLWMSFRQQLRLKFDMEQNTLKTFMGDCAVYCCCWSCAIAQEARHIEEACRAAHKAVRKFEAA